MKVVIRHWQFWVIIVLVDVLWSCFTTYFIEDRLLSIVVNVALCCISTVVIAWVYLAKANK